MIINHTSPSLINKVTSSHSSLFRGALFFSDDVYIMTSSNEVHLYQVELQENEIIDFDDLIPSENVLDQLKLDVSCLFDLEIDDETASDLLLSSDYDEQLEIISNLLEEDNRDLFDIGYEYIGELSWNIQGLQALCAREMGFLACESQDEQGTVYALNLVDLESRLIYKGQLNNDA